VQLSLVTANHLSSRGIRYCAGNSGWLTISPPLASSTENLNRVLRFGEFDLDPAAGELRRRGVRIKLQEQPLQVLLMLALRAGETVTRDEMRKTLWPSDTFVDFDHSLNSAVMRLRETLRDSAESPRFVETVPKRGYRFVAPVTHVTSEAPRPSELPPSTPELARSPVAAPPSPAGSDVTPQATALATPGPPTHRVSPVPQPVSTSAPIEPNRPWPSAAPVAVRTWALTAALVVVVITCVVALVIWRRSASSADAGAIQSIAVLPIENLTGDKDQEYLADGVTDEITAGLAKIRSLRVISRTSAISYKDTRKPLPQIARELNVDAVVEGTVRRSGKRIRITTELIHAATDRHLWVETYDTELSDILTAEADVVRAIAKEIRVSLTPEEQRQIAARAMSPAGYEAYLKGRYHWNQRTAESLKRAIEFFQQAVKADPGSALAYAGLADSYDILASVIIEAVPTKDAYPKAKEAALKAVQLDDSLAEAHTALGTMSFNYDWDWAAAGRELKRALELDPNYATAHQRYSLYLMAQGRSAESISEMMRARELDPMSESINFSLGWRLYFARRYDEAINQLRATLDLNPNSALAHLVLGESYKEKNQLDAAIRELETAARLSSNAPFVLGPLGQAYGRAGRRAEAHRVLNQLQELAQRQYVSAVHPAEVYAGLGDHSAALQWLEKAYQERSNNLIFLKVDPAFDSLRSDPQFLDLVRRVGLP
jgi:TolB-like protein/DNA-binding winged helix-turn-helix (wHTH) protein/Tfp pilus assembly protein PilF